VTTALTVTGFLENAQSVGPGARSYYEAPSSAGTPLGVSLVSWAFTVLAAVAGVHLCLL